MTPTQHKVLEFVRSQNGMPRPQVVTHLAKHLGIRRTSAQNAYDRLVAKGIIEVERPPEVLKILREMSAFLKTVKAGSWQWQDLERLQEKILEAGGSDG